LHGQIVDKKEILDIRPEVVMKVQCPKCKEFISMEDFSTSQEGLRFNCPDCLDINFLPNPKAQTAVATLEAPEASPPEPQRKPVALTATSPEMDEDILCPKCGHAQNDPEACHRCGLVFAAFDPDSIPPDPPEAAALWEEVLKRPHDPDLNERFVMACNQANRLEYATRQYRIMKRDPGMAEVAAKMMDRILSLSMAQSQVGPMTLDTDQITDAIQRKKRVIWSVTLVMLIIGLGAVFYVVYSQL
jgi:hypothetical protein